METAKKEVRNTPGIMRRMEWLYTTRPAIRRCSWLAKLQLSGKKHYPDDPEV